MMRGRGTRKDDTGARLDSLLKPTADQSGLPSHGPDWGNPKPGSVVARTVVVNIRVQFQTICFISVDSKARFQWTGEFLYPGVK